MLWVDKYRPRTLDKVMVHKEEATNLKNLVSVGFLVGSLLWCDCRVGGFDGCSFWVSDSARWLSPSSVLWTVWRWQEDPYHGIATGDVWAQCWEGAHSSHLKVLNLEWDPRFFLGLRVVRLFVFYIVALHLHLFRLHPSWQVVVGERKGLGFCDGRGYWSPGNHLALSRVVF